MADAPAIFIIGTGRSGTTLLRLMLSAHPNIYIAHEASFYVWESLFPKSKSATEFLRFFVQTFSFRWLDLDPRQVFGDLPNPLPRERVHEAHTALLKAKAARYGRTRYGDKTPAHAGHIKRLYADYPDAKIIHIVRDPRAVVRSMQRMPWASAAVTANAMFCEVERKQVAPYQSDMHQLRLEDLIANPEQVMRGVLDFVGEPWDDAVLDHAAHIPDHKDMPPLPWLTPATGRIRRGPDDRPQLSAVQLRLVESLNKNSMREYAYDPAHVTKEPSRLRVLAALLAELPEALRFAWYYLRLGLTMRDPKHFDAPHSKALFARLNPPSWRYYPDLVEIPDAPPLPEDWELPFR